MLCSAMMLCTCLKAFCFAFKCNLRSAFELKTCCAWWKHSTRGHRHRKLCPHEDWWLRTHNWEVFCLVGKRLGSLKVFGKFESNVFCFGPLSLPFQRFDRTIHSAVYSPDGTMIAAATDDHEAKLRTLRYAFSWRNRRRWFVSWCLEFFFWTIPWPSSKSFVRSSFGTPSSLSRCSQNVKHPSYPWYREAA